MSTAPADSSLLSKIASYTEILAKDPHSTIFVPLSDAYLRMGLPEEALELAEKGVQALPRFCPGFVMLGRIQLERGNLPAAAAAFETAYSMDDENIPAIKGLVRVLVRQGNRERARELLQQAAGLAPEDAGIQKMLASLAPGRPANPPVKGNVAAVKGKEPIATPTIAEIYLRQGLPHRALKVYRDLQKAHPESDEFRLKLTEVEKLLHSQVAAEKGAVPVAEVPQTPVSVPAMSAEPEKIPSLVDAEDRRLKILNNWLDAIRRRKHDVLQ